ncbi:NAD(P)/FAD-dependent oxidoreductase [Bradyrhizobium canariense]|uniref:Thioredoxin reductase n=1 Tax=Bradyrhizobium canariense TaxID=255045 RepID=A0A1H2B638_9BRAD|nr:FAD-dependent oxidoreductase [Bradyrhizobium canariense]SDT53537.1 thioredoxin reductase (NADPH) [Bradyrhizobium canariense]
MQNTDVVVIGAGVAGLTAAMIAAGQGVSTLVIEQLAPGGQIATIESIQNFPGFPDGIAGYELGPLLQQQAEAAGAMVQLDTVSAITVEGSNYRLVCAGEEIVARAVIIAAGSALRKLGIPGEVEFTGRGVSHCAACDGPLFKGQVAVVIGGGDSAFDEALVLAGYASEIMLIHRGSSPSARPSAIAQLAALPHVRILADAEIVAIEGDKTVTGVSIRSGAETERNPCRAVFIYTGLEPRSSIVKEIVRLDADGHIVTDPMMRASRPGLFAAGDIRAGSVNLLAAVAGDAATAAISAVRYLRAEHENKNIDREGNDFGVAERSRRASGH